MPSLREEYDDIEFRLAQIDQRERSVLLYQAFAEELDTLDYKLQRAALPPDEQVELGKLSARIRGRVQREMHDLQHPTILSPQLPRHPEGGRIPREYDRRR